MPNFYISVSNGLLEGDHQERMGAAVWQFMWLLDKITKIDSNGDGWVLGGKPINLTDLGENRSKVTMSRNLQRLKKEGYIELQHTAYGIIVKVKKAKKRFNTNDNPRNENDKPRFKNDNPNKTVSVRQDNKTIILTDGQRPDKRNPGVTELWDYGQTLGFSTVKQNLNRYAITRLLKGKTLEQLKKAAEFSQAIRQEAYAPQINNWMDLEEKYLKLRDFVARKQNNPKKGKVWKTSPSSPSLPALTTK